MNLKIEPNLHWTDDILYWGSLCLVAIKRKKSQGTAFYELRGIAFEEWLREQGGHAWMDSNGPLRLPDDGMVHDFLAILYRQVLSVADYTVSTTRGTNDQ